MKNKIEAIERIDSKIAMHHLRPVKQSLDNKIPVRKFDQGTVSLTLKSFSRLHAFALFIACAWPLAPAAAQEEGNWARTFVAARVAVRNFQAVPPAARGSGSDMDNVRTMMRDAGRIVGGTNATPSQNPAQVALLLRADPNVASAQFCGGTLVSPRIVVTAAHCSDFVNNSAVQVLTGARRLDGSGVRRNVSRISIHPDFNTSTLDNDVAVWEMSTAETTQAVARLATSDGNTGDNLLVSGWGRLSEGGPSATMLQAVSVPLVSRNDCNDANSYNGDITSSMLCAGFDSGAQDACQGDSGGPITRGSDNSVLTGVVSWGIGCARPNLYGIYARISHLPIRQFLQEAIGEELAEDCVTFNPSNLRVSRINGDTKIIDGNHWVWSFGDKTEAARRSLSIVQGYGANRSCFVGRPRPEMTYLLVGSAAPQGVQQNEDCLGFNPANLRVLESGGQFVLTDGRSRMIAFDRSVEAQSAISVIRAKGFTRQCFQGRPNPPFKYFRS